MAKGAARGSCISNTRLVTKQVLCSYCYMMVCCGSEVKGPIPYHGENVVKYFLESLQDELVEIREVLKHPAKICICDDDQKDFLKTTVCHICGEDLGEDRVRDHYHITGKYRRAVYNACNLKLRIYPNKTKIQIVFHNLRGYDGHLIMTETTAGEKVGCISKNMEKYMTLCVGQLQFINSLQFMNCSLERLVANLQTENLIITSKGLSDKELALLRRKGVYPYDSMDSHERFDELQLPSKEDFYCLPSRETISDTDYDHAQNIWKEFGCHTLSDYHDLYLRTDVQLLADVFETFRDTSMKYFDLDPASYFSAPGMSWDALLKLTKVKLELFTGLDQHLFMDRCLREG